MKRSIVVAVVVAFIVAELLLTPAPAEAQKKGQSAKIQHGVVVKAERVDLNDSKTTQGALVGGTIGLIASSGKSGKTKRRNTALGAVGGGLIGSARSTSQMGMMYTVEIAGGAVKVVTDQTEIHMGDCVVVEETSQGTNLRRVNPEVCDPAAAEVVAELQDEFVEEAEECAMARKELAAAKTDAEFDRALMKLDILCNG
jgi:outer membrane lipoprotein SlyB